MKQELILEKYTPAPIQIELNDNNMLECNGVTVADNVLIFDAVTDISGAIHGVLLNSDGQILYFRLSGGLPVSKSIASGVSSNILKHLSITELDGILHILIVKCEKSFTVHHYRTQGNSWIRSYPKSLDVSTEYIDSCPCSSGKYALLTKNDNREILYVETLGRWQQLQQISLPPDYTDISMSYLNGNIEIITNTKVNGIKISATVSLDSRKSENDSFVIKEISKDMEDNMANGSIINSKYISQLQEAVSEIAILKEELEQLKSSTESMRKTFENYEKQYKYITACRDALKQHDTQLNQTNIKIQELSNRFNGFVKLHQK